MKYDAIVIGAGLSGLHCAKKLQDKGKSILILEASDRVGGRLFAKEYRGKLWDLGGQWIAPQQSRMHNLLSELDLKLIPQEEVGNTVVETIGHRAEYAGVYPPEFDQCTQKEQALADQLPADSPWQSNLAAELDTLTVSGWVERTFGSNSAVTADHTGVRGLMAAEGNEMSMLCWLMYIRSGGGIDVMGATEGGGQQDKIVGSAWNVCHTYANKLAPSVLVFNAAVTSVLQRDDVCRVQTMDGRVFFAERVICAAPLTMVSRIHFTPRLSTARDRLIQGSAMGAVIKCIVFYDTPWWRNAGYNGLSISSYGDVSMTYDACTRMPDGSILPALVLFSLGAAARHWSDQPAANRKAAFLAGVARIFKSDQALTAQHYLEQDWCAQPFIHGAYGSFYATGVLSLHGHALTTPCGRVHWAGTETASQWCGYMEGALCAAERAVSEVLQALDVPVSPPQLAKL
eukprot:TRINITY_DN12897_c0_g1_i1.p1 TRINITY_DN12897_c0_g1~~TRINITY_DN12897_c0_g1_i1.p1  ORF type:complete len:458 (-),score=85.03 TRINITY_DN12897_c0_g1_i1:29-1402(-)